MSHSTRQLAKLLNSLSRGGTPLRHARGVVVSSNIGQSVVTPDGGSTQITAYNYSHAQALPAGAVVDLLLVGGQGYVLGSYGYGWVAVPSTGNGWGIGSPAPAYILLGGIVYMRGTLTAGTANTTAFTLPAGYRPSGTMTFSVNTSTVSSPNTITVNTSGTVVPTSSAQTALGGVIFPIA